MKNTEYLLLYASIYNKGTNITSDPLCKDLISTHVNPDNSQ